MILYFLKGIIIGALVAFPIGPIGILCLRRLLIQGPLIGIASGLGAATADLIFSFFAIIGIAFISSFMLHQFILFRLMSSIFLCAVGLAIFFTKPPKTRTNLAHSLAESFFSTFFLTLANPLIIITIGAALALFGITHVDSKIAMVALMTGIFIGSSSWWLALGTIASYWHMRINPSTLQLVNRISGSLILSFAFFYLLTIFLTFIF